MFSPTKKDNFKKLQPCRLWHEKH